MGHVELRSLHIHPVKAFRAIGLEEAVVEPWGLAGDRRWALIDDGERSSRNAGIRISHSPPPSFCPAAVCVCPHPGRSRSRCPCRRRGRP